MEGLRSNFLVEWGVAAQALAGETESGDQYLVEPFLNGVLAAVVDGLGHGADASAVTQTAIAIMREHAAESILPLVRRCHAALLQTRGVVLSLASFNALDESMTWLGVGNVEGILFHGNKTANPSRIALLLRGGVVGYQLPPLRIATLPVTPGDLLILATDGIRNGFTKGLKVDLPAQFIADQILAQYGRQTDDTLVLAVRYLGMMK